MSPHPRKLQIREITLQTIRTVLSCEGLDDPSKIYSFSTGLWLCLHDRTHLPVSLKSWKSRSAWVRRFTSCRRYCGGGGSRLAALCCCVSHARTTHTLGKHARTVAHTRVHIPPGDRVGYQNHPVQFDSYHSLTSRIKVETMFKCPLCLKELESKEALLLHKTTVHPKASEGASADGAVAGNMAVWLMIFLFHF